MTEKKDGRGSIRAFADELKAQREAAGLTQEELAARMGYSASVIAKLETGRTRPLAQHAEQADRSLCAPGTFVRLREAVVNGMSEWVRALLDLEERAAILRWWEPLVVPGLLQTEAYARAILRAARPGDSGDQVERLIAQRMARQDIWARQTPPPPMLFAVIGESVLRQWAGEPAVMRDQMARLAEAADHPRITVQVVPFSAMAHPGLLGPFLVASFDHGPDTAYLDNALNGQVTERRNEVCRVSLLYDTLLRDALSPRASRDLIMKVGEEWT